MPERYILDTSAILEHPEVLAAIAPGRIIIPKAVLEELERTKLRGTGSLLRQSLEATLGNGAKIADHPSSKALRKIAEDPRARSLAGADLSIAALALEYSSRRGPKAVVVVTRDRALAKFLESEGVKSWTIAEFLTDKALNQRDEKIEALTKDLVRRQRRYLVLSLVIGVLAAFIGNLAFAHLGAFVDAFHVSGTLVAVPCIGIALYWVRERFQLLYGIVEFFVGVTMACKSLLPHLDTAGGNLTFGIKVLAGLYVAVRGLDNIGKGCEGTRLQPHWKRIFHR